MIGRGRIFFSGVVFFTLLAGYLIDGWRINRAAERRRHAEALLQRPLEELTEFTVARGGVRCVMRKTGEVWNLVEPVEDRADPEWIAQALEAFKAQTVANPIHAGGSELASYGLAQSGLWIELGPEAAEGKIFIGDDTPVAGRVYARRDGSNEVFTISATLRDLVKRETHDFRDHRLLPVDPTQATILEITHEGRSLKLVKTDQATRSGAWKVIQPEESPADDETVEGILQELQTTRVADFITTGRLELEALGLAAPSLVVSLVTPDTPDLKPVTLAIGRRTLGSPPLYYAQAAGSSRVFTAPQSLVDKLRVSPLDIRAKSLFSLTEERVGRFNFRYGGSGVRLVKDDDGVWREDAPEGGKSDPIEQKLVQSLIKGLLRMRAAEYLITQPLDSQSGMDNPIIVASFSTSDGEEVEGIEIGRPAPGKPRAYARKLGGEVFLVDDEILNRYFFLRDDFLVRKVFSFEPAQVARIELRETISSQRVWIFEKRGDFWQYQADASAKPYQIKPTFPERFLLSMADLRWKSRLDPSAPADAALIEKYGLSQPVLTIRLTDASGGELAFLGQGGDDQQTKAYIREGQSNFYVMEIKGIQPYIDSLKAMLTAR